MIFFNLIRGLGRSTDLVDYFHLVHLTLWLIALDHLVLGNVEIKPFLVAGSAVRIRTS
jgi:hypothetical protein